MEHSKEKELRVQNTGVEEKECFSQLCIQSLSQTPRRTWCLRAGKYSLARFLSTMRQEPPFWLWVFSRALGKCLESQRKCPSLRASSRICKKSAGALSLQKERLLTSPVPSWVLNSPMLPYLE